MSKELFFQLGLVVLIGLIGWDNWQLREELAQLRQARTTQAVVTPTAKSGVLINQRPTSPLGEASPQTPTVSTVTSEGSATPSQISAPVAIPPGTDLLEAIKIFQREQAKNDPGSAALNPFGSPK